MSASGDDREARYLGDWPDRCIWMTAGLVSYKLCDRRFECDGCPLDAAFTGSSDAHDRRPTDRSELPDWTFPSDRGYGPAHVWVREVAGERVRLGIDALAARLLVRVNQVQLPDIGEALARGGSAGVATIDGGEVVFRSPLDGRVTQVNLALTRSPSPLVRDPYWSGWLCELEASGSEAAETLTPASAMRQRLGYDLRHFRKRLACYLVADSVSVGRTMADGGEPLTDLRQILGRESFLRLLQEIIA